MAVPAVAGGLLAAAANAAPTHDDELDARDVLAKIRAADASLSLGEDWRECYSCFLWQPHVHAPPAWASALADKTFCSEWNSAGAHCNGGSGCELKNACAACHSDRHGVLETRSTGYVALLEPSAGNKPDHYVCPMTRALHKDGHDVVNYSAIVKFVRSSGVCFSHA